MNDSSSRSHLVFIMNLYLCNKHDMSTKISKVVLVDLAGS